jgi:hypothetical protein
VAIAIAELRRANAERVCNMTSSPIDRLPSPR